ncbi:MAG: glycosyltransferase family 4 protein [Steroidobacteraceae bacterium]
MRIAMIFYSFPRDMGYSNTMLARYLARLGADVHYIATDLPVYHKSVDARSAYTQFSADATMSPGQTELYDGYRVHCIAHRYVLGVPMFTGLSQKLREIQPDVVQLLINAGWAPLQTAAAKLAQGFTLYSAAHTTVSIFPLARRKTHFWDPAWLANLMARAIPGRLVSLVTERCYAATADCAEVAARFYGMPEAKIAVVPLGVDTQNFYPAKSAAELEQRLRLRRELELAEDDLVCIYTGQLTDGKNPVILARAVALLREQGTPVRGLFIGNGPQRDQIAACDGCTLLPFRPHRELPPYYRAADIGVWPTQESMSMLDAAACGLPIIVNDTLLATERIEGNGISYRLNDVGDLAQKIRSLSEPAHRRELGSVGARRMVELFSWDAIARRRLADYEAAVAECRQSA